jgi:hypothetical protein
MEIENQKQDTKENSAKFQAEKMFSEKQMDDAYDKGFKDASERMYSEEDMLAFLDWSKSTNKEKSEYELKCLLNRKDIDSKKLFIMWFSKFKNQNNEQ